MKRNLYLILALLLLGVVQVRAQQIAVVTADKTTEYAQWPYESAKITFTNGQMLFHYDGNVVGTFNIKDVEKLFFYLTGSMDEIQKNKVVAYSSDCEELSVNSPVGTSVVVYHVNGNRVLSHLQTIASSTISVAHLPAGIYMVVVGSETLKFVKQ
ncbi:MAG: T9SS type A sorting domain-containing protein [Bacteroidaceae bacterium]|nr:T9SS type A sorting domain-containing protein [Bacteroidaceae bacterium]